MPLYPPPDWVRRLNYLGPSIGGAAQLVPPFDAEELMARARQSTGLTDFGGDSWCEPMARLLTSLDGEAELNSLGRILTRAELIRLLRTRLLMTEFHRRHPERAQQALPQPVFITGPGRTGTSILLELLALDPRLRAPLAWEAIHPLPLADGAVLPERIQLAESEQELWADILPEFDAVHELRAALPVECITAMACEFHIGHWMTTCNVLEFAAWRTLESDPLPAYTFHKRFFQLLSEPDDSRRWLFKSPAHLSGLVPLFATYPDAKLIHTHRDPLKTVPSTASTTAHSQAIRSDHHPKLERGPLIALSYQMMEEEIIRQREAGELPVEQITDLLFADFMRDPVAAIETVYPTLALEFREEDARRIRDYLATKPQGKHGVHRYTLEEYGLDAQELREQFAGYCDYYGVMGE